MMGTSARDILYCTYLQTSTSLSNHRFAMCRVCDVFDENFPDNFSSSLFLSSFASNVDKLHNHYTGVHSVSNELEDIWLINLISLCSFWATQSAHNATALHILGQKFEEVLED